MKHMILGSALRLPVVLAILGFATIDATAQEICGLASVQYNLMHSDGFEGQQAVNAASHSQAVRKPNPHRTRKRKLPQ